MNTIISLMPKPKILIFCLLYFVFSEIKAQQKQKEEPVDASCDCTTETPTTSYNLADLQLDVSFPDEICTTSEGIIQFKYPDIYLNLDSFSACASGLSTGAIDSIRHIITAFDFAGIYQTTPIIYSSLVPPPSNLDLLEQLNIHDTAFNSYVCDGLVDTLLISYKFQIYGNGGLVSNCDSSKYVSFTCPSSTNLNASIFTSTASPSCNPINVTTIGRPLNTHHSWYNVTGGLNQFISNNSLITIDDPTVTDLEVYLVDSNFAACEIGYDTLTTTVQYVGFDPLITNIGPLNVDCSDPTAAINFPDLLLVNSPNFASHSFQWFEVINGNSFLMPGETNALLSNVSEDGRFRLRVRLDSVGCTEITNTLEVSGIRSQLYTLGVDGGNVICLGDTSPDLNFNPPLPIPFPTGATMDVFYNGVSQGNDISINNEGEYYVEISYPGGCRPFSDTLIADLDTNICGDGFVFSPASLICTQDPVAFINLGINDTSIQYSWSFSGGNPSSATGFHPPLVHFPRSGTYAVRLTVTTSIGSETFTEFVEVIDDCCEREYEISDNSSFGTVLGETDLITTITGGGTFDGIYNVLGTIVLQNGVYTVNDNTVFFVESSCNNCDYFATVDDNCSVFSDKMTQIIVGTGATLRITDTEFRAACNEMWYGLGIVNGGSIESAISASHNNALIQDALAGITVCDPEGVSNLTYNLDGVTFTNNIIGLNDLDFTSSNNLNFVSNSFFDNNDRLMKAPYAGRIGLANINLISTSYISDFNNNLVSNANYGYFHRMAHDPDVEYHITNNTVREFQRIGIAIGGGRQISEIVNTRFEFPKTAIGDENNPIPDYPSYSGEIGNYYGLPFFPTEYNYYSSIIGALKSGNPHFYDNVFIGQNGLNAPSYQVGSLFGTFFGGTNPITRNNTYNNLDHGVWSYAQRDTFANNLFADNKTAFEVFMGDPDQIDVVLLQNNTFERNECAIQIQDHDVSPIFPNYFYELSVKENRFIDNDTSISIKYAGTFPMDLTLECNSFELTNTTTYDRYGLLIHTGSNIGDIGGNGGLGQPTPAGNGWPANPLSPGYSNCITGTNPVDVNVWSAPNNWLSINDLSSSAWNYFAFDNEFMDESNSVLPNSTIVDRTFGGPVIIGHCQIQDICFPLARIQSILAGTEEVDFKVYPNPVENKFFVELREAFETLAVYDIVGNKLEVPYLIFENKLEMNSLNLSKGTYILTVLFKDGSIKTGKFTK